MTMEALNTSAGPSKATAFSVIDGAGRTMIPTNEIMPNPNQPREYFDPEFMGRLVSNIQEFGHEKPIKIMLLPEPNGSVKYMIKDGEFRWRASIEAKKDVWAIIEPFIDDQDLLFEQALNANYPQAPFTPAETIKSILRLENMGRTGKQIALVFGKSEAWVVTHKRLAGLTPKVLAMTGPDVPEDKRLQLGHADLISELPTSQQLGLAQITVSAGLSLAHLKNLVRETRADRQVPNNHYGKGSNVARNEMRGLVGRFVKFDDSVSMFVRRPDIFHGIVKNRPTGEIVRLREAVAKAQADMVKIVEMMEQYRTV